MVEGASRVPHVGHPCGSYQQTALWQVMGLHVKNEYQTHGDQLHGIIYTITIRNTNYAKHQRVVFRCGIRFYPSILIYFARTEQLNES